MGRLIGSWRRGAHVYRLLWIPHKSSKSLSSDDGINLLHALKAARDAVNARPSAVHELGMSGAIQRMAELCEDALARVLVCEGRHELVALIRGWSMKLLPKSRQPPADAVGAVS